MTVRCVSLAVLVAVVIAVYAPIGQHSFVDYDTDIYLRANSMVREGLSWEGVRWAFRGFHAANYHPLTWLSHMLDVELFGLHPAGHLWVNVAWHALNAVLVACILARLRLPWWMAWALAMLFALHPLRVEPVAWIVERKDLLACAFGFAALLLWLPARESGRALLYMASCLAFAASLLAKPMLVTLPGVMLLLEYWPQQRRDWRPRARDGWLVCMLLMAVGASWLTIQAQAGFGAMQSLEQRSLLDRLGAALEAYRWYWASQVWPVDLCFHYPLRSLSLWELALRAGAMGALLWCLWSLRRTWPALCVGSLWFLGALFPVSGVLQVGAQAYADRFSYYPSVGLLLAIGSATWILVRPLRWLWLPWLFLAAGCAVLTRQQLRTWRDTESMARQALSVNSNNSVAHVQLGIALGDRGQIEPALVHLRQAQALAPRDPDMLLNLGALLIRNQQLEAAQACLEQAVDLVPERALAWSHLGALHYLRGQYAPALECLNQALELEPGAAGARVNRAAVLEATGQREQARQEYEAVLRVYPELPSARQAYAQWLWKSAQAALAAGDPRSARELLQRALPLSEGRERLRQQIEEALAKLGA